MVARHFSAWNLVTSDPSRRVRYDPDPGLINRPNRGTPIGPNHTVPYGTVPVFTRIPGNKLPGYHHLVPPGQSPTALMAQDCPTPIAPEIRPLCSDRIGYYQVDRILAFRFWQRLFPMNPWETFLPDRGITQNDPPPTALDWRPTKRLTRSLGKSGH